MSREGCPPGTYKIDHKCKRFTSSDFLSARDKNLVYTKYRNFLDSLGKEYNRERVVNNRKHFAPFFKFHERLYEHLHLDCGFIAHTDRQGFYATYFSNPEDTIVFVNHMKKAESHCSEDCKDLNEALAVETKRQASKIIPIMKTIAKKQDIDTARALLKKHGLKIKGYRK